MPYRHHCQAGHLEKAPALHHQTRLHCKLPSKCSPETLAVRSNTSCAASCSVISWAANQHAELTSQRMQHLNLPLPCAGQCRQGVWAMRRTPSSGATSTSVRLSASGRTAMWGSWSTGWTGSWRRRSGPGLGSGSCAGSWSSCCNAGGTGRQPKGSNWKAMGRQPKRLDRKATGRQPKRLDRKATGRQPNRLDGKAKE